MDFKLRYRRECIAAKTSPLHVIEASNVSLDFKFFRIPESEWAPVLEALKNDTTLKRISVSIDLEDKSLVENRIHKQKLRHLEPFIWHLSQHLLVNSNLTELHLKGLPMTARDVEQISKGVLKAKSLQHLSFSHSPIGDEGLQYIADAVQGKPNIVWLDVSKCNLTESCGAHLFKIVRHQSINRENALWKASLRNETPDLDLMGGLRRLTLSDNNLGDAVVQLAKALQQDKWIKAIDLQNCNLNDIHVSCLISVAYNGFLVFIDLQKNLDVKPDVVERLQGILEANLTSKNSPFIFKSIETSRPKIASRVTQKPKVIANSKSTTSPEKGIKKLPCKKVSPSKANLQKTPSASPHSKSVSKPKRRPSLSPEPHPIDSSGRDEELLREREARLDAERQVIKVYGELELAWTKIAKLEAKIKQLKRKKQPHNHVAPSSQPSPMMLHQETGMWVDQPTLENFQYCLVQFQMMLRDLKQTHQSVSLTKPEQPGNQVTDVLSTLHSAVRDLVSKVSRSSSEELPRQFSTESSESRSSRPIPAAPYAIENGPVSESSSGRRSRGTIPTTTETPSRSQTPSSARDGIVPPDVRVHRLENPTPAQLVSPVPDVQKVSVIPRTLTSTPLSEASAPKANPASTILKTVGSKKDTTPSPLMSEATPPAVVAREAVPSYKEPSSGEPSRSEGREKSLKNLKGDLEELLEQFRVPMEASSFKFATSLLSAKSSDDTTTASQSNKQNDYSMDFDSTTTSIQSIQPPKGRSSQKGTSTPSIPDKPAGSLPESRNSEKQKKSKTGSNSGSGSSSTMNLSSIVDLLGDFSVNDIGSSTLTPP